MSHAFISYSRSDADFVRRVIAILEGQSEVNVWFDQEDIPCSLPWLDEVTSAIRCARFMVVFDSLGWFESSNCTLELRTAESLDVPVLHIDTQAMAPEVAAGWISSWWQDLAGPRDDRTELLERAFRWESAGRPRQMLVRGKLLKKLRDAGWRYGVPESMPYVNTFISKSFNRQTRRRVTVVGGVFVVFMLWSQGLDFWGSIFDGVGRKSSTPAAAASVTNLIDLKVDADPYYAVDTGSLLVQVDLNSIPEKRWEQLEPYYASRRALVQLMQIELPASVAPAAPVALAPTGSVVRAQAGGRDLVGTVGEAEVTVEGAGAGPELRFSSGVSALAASTDGMLLAAAVGDTVEVRDTQSGDVFRVLRGGTARIAEVGWEAGGESVQGTTVDGRILTWRIDRGIRTLNDGGFWIMDAERDSVTGDVFTLARNGTVMRMSGRDGSVQQTWQVPVGIATRIAVKDSTVLVVAATDGADDDLQALDVMSGAVSEVPSAGCTTRDVDVSTAGEMALACREGVGLAESVGAAVKVSPLPDGDFVDTVVWTREGIVAGSTNGGLWGVTRAGEPRRFTGCVGAMQELAVVPDRDVVFNAGSAVAPQCAHRYEGASTDEVSRLTLLPEADTRSAQAVATSPDGRMLAYGFANGAVAVMEVATGDPLFTTTVEGGSVRGLAFNEEGSSVFVASRFGQFHVIDVSAASKAPEELLAAVRSRVDETVRMGLYERPEGLDEVAASAEAALTD